MENTGAKGTAEEQLGGESLGRVERNWRGAERRREDGWRRGCRAVGLKTGRVSLDKAQRGWSRAKKLGENDTLMKE